MSELITHATRNPQVVAVLVAAAIAVLVYELRHRKLSLTAISPQDAVRLMNQGAAVLDVRSAEDFAAGHLSTARHAPLDKLTEAAEGIKRFKDRPVLVYCERGARSNSATAKLAVLGFSKVFNLRGGVAAWRTDNLPLVKN
jgi:rhodanese-related sulfurtransferase